MNLRTRTFGLGVLALSVMCSLITAGCGKSEEGAMLSDDEKLQKFQQGRESYQKGMQGGAKTLGTPAPAPK